MRDGLGTRGSPGHMVVGQKQTSQDQEGQRGETHSDKRRLAA